MAYGSNLSSGTETASQAFDRLVKTLRERGLFINKISRLWQSQAWPNPQDPAYVNAVISVKTHLQPADLMQVLHDVEHEFGRVRGAEKNAPRVVDLDLVAYGRVILDGEGGIIVPHPRAADRGFVMGPLTDILPGWVHPVLNRTATELWTQATVARDAHPVAG
ncbi:2-amino-4-hydroxy-6-hydroxymethyldihydropteridine diphosphokinase [Asticcacaulis biprosthecium]|uniref:2-amino-4-hydroxy-6- hydroxymethyldihydropteridine diphosphokinase n=1 Tax=Asticcacaulis biprosthecium TaxID=76891 RepID=UPI000A071902|nr:2-amino-4-hydroxy-6-hydroxymethyldihydropteridine diphosphokinase [Asticcacaulis biprosthecium]